MSNEADHSFIIFPYKDEFRFLYKPTRLRFYYKNYSFDFLNDSRGEGISSLLKELDEKKVHDKKDEHYVLHLFYEAGFLFNRLDELVDEDMPLALELEFEKSSRLVWGPKKKTFAFKEDHAPEWEDYFANFQKGKNFLLNGDCYQYNLTAPFEFSFKDEIRPLDFIGTLWANHLNRGAYGSFTYLSSLKLSYLSNSPECLFQLYEDGLIESMPIKGTLSTEGRDWKEAWRELVNSQKNENELNMITDLIRNDLSKIAGTVNEVKDLKSPLRVPGIIHSFSRIQTQLPEGTSLLSVLEGLFPGGSITGAPKKRVMEILNQLEKRERGFYCGSTVFWFKDLKAASINIRSSQVDFKHQLFSYQAGGGITFRSSPQEEWEELHMKVKSFTSLLDCLN